jgi:hypothetical protein
LGSPARLFVQFVEPNKSGLLFDFEELSILEGQIAVDLEYIGF